MPKVSLSKTLLLSAVSAGVALLFAPKSGKELRADLKEEAVKAKDKGMEYANDFVNDLKESYEEVETEMARENPELAQKIDEIEQDLYLQEAEVQDPVVNPDLSLSAPVEPTAETEDGNVRGTPMEPDEDQTIPSDELDEALSDNYLSDEDEINTDDDQRAGNKGLWSDNPEGPDNK